MDRLFKIESYHDDGRGSVNPKVETFIAAHTWFDARAFACRTFGCDTSQVMLSEVHGAPPIDSLVLTASAAA